MVSKNNITPMGQPEWMISMERRMRALERSQQMSNSGVTNTLGDLIFFSVDDDGIKAPWFSHPWREASHFKTMTSGSYSIAHRCRVELLYWPELRFTVFVNVASGTTGRLKITNDATSDETDEVSLTSAFSNTIEVRWQHGITVGGGPIDFQIEVIRDTGAGNIDVYTPAGLVLGGNVPDATSGGIYSP